MDIMLNTTLLYEVTISNSSYNETFSTIVFPNNETTIWNEEENRDSLYLIIPLTVIYVMIFITGCIGNISTCIVIARNKSMYSATNYYLFSLAVSDFMLLISGVPMELYHIWYKNEFIFGEAFCILRNMINEMSANATVLTITAFTIERYVAICHPFLSHTMSKLSRAIKYIFLIWILSISCAVPQAIQTGIFEAENGNSWCTVLEERVLVDHLFELATVLFFFAPMALITVLYILIGMKLRSSTMIKRENGSTVQRNLTSNLTSNINQNTNQSTKRVLKMLVAVVICFGLCWAPFHAQRLVYMWAMKIDDPLIQNIFICTTYASGILYYVSTCINPLLYNIMSNKFRQAFKETLQKKCCKCSSTQTNNKKRQYRILSRGQRRHGQPESTEYSGNSGKDDYSSSTQKQSIDTIATSRNTSLRKYKLNRSFTDTSPPAVAMRLSSPRNSDVGDKSNCHACLSAKVTSSEINILSGYNINEIRLNIFPPSAKYVKDPSTCTTNNQADKISQSHLNIDVYEKMNEKVTTESKRKVSLGYLSHISLKRCDSILHISIGNSSKITKRHKKNSWLFAKWWKLSNKRKSPSNRKYFFSPQLNKDGIFRLSGGSLNLINDELMISINSQNHGDLKGSASSATDGHRSQLNHISSDYNDTLQPSSDGANELDYYMNEIKRREMR